MTTWTRALCTLALVFVFLLLNRAAYKGYFQDDEFDNINWAPRTPASTYLEGVLTPRFFANNFRPAGHFYFFAAARLFDLDFPKYVAALQLLHLFNVWLIWMLARKFEAPPVAGLLACIFFALHMALFEAFWKPMYVFDVLCGTFCLLAVLLWAYHRWVLSFIAFWLGYKSKELAVMLPVVLVCYEYWLGKRRWRYLIPFFAVSLSFGLQGLILNPNQNNDYSFRFSVDAFRKTTSYYAGRIFLVPYLGFLAPLALLTGRNRRTWLGLAMCGIFFLPLLFLPGRLFSAYCYLPFAGLALALSGIAESKGWVPVLVFLLLFAPLDLRELRARRRATLALDDDIRGWVQPVREFAGRKPAVNGVVYSGQIPGFASWGVEGAISYLFRDDRLRVVNGSDPQAREFLKLPRVAFIVWNPGIHRSMIAVHTPDTPDVAYFDFDRNAPIWQLEKGWFGLEGGFRWTADIAEARLSRPEDARVFEMRVLAGPDRFAGRPATFRVSLNGEELEPRVLTKAGWQNVSWDLPAGRAGTVQVRLQTDPLYQSGGDGRKLGIAVGALGFVSGSR